MKKFWKLGACASAALAFASGAWAHEVPTTLGSATAYGFLQLNGVYDITPQSPSTWYTNLARQPADSKPRGGAYLTARNSRLGLKGKFPDGETSFLLEADFHGNNNENVTRPVASTAFRLRHAYVESGSWLFGQAWSNAFDAGASLESVDTSSQLTSGGVRQAQVRYTTDLSPQAKFSLSLENPAVYPASANTSQAATVTTATATASSRTPDIVLRATHTADWGHLSAIALTHDYVFDNGISTRSNTGGLMGLSGSFKLANDKLVYGVYRGAGAGRYQWGTTYQAAFDDGNQVQTFKSSSYHYGYTHKWNDKVRTNFNRSYVLFDDQVVPALKSLENQVNNKRLSQYQINTFVALNKSVEAGAEWAYGKRDGQDKSVSHEQRVNFSLTARF